MRHFPYFCRRSLTADQSGHISESDTGFNSPRRPCMPHKRSCLTCTNVLDTAIRTTNGPSMAPSPRYETRSWPVHPNGDEGGPSSAEGEGLAPGSCEDSAVVRAKADKISSGAETSSGLRSSLSCWIGVN